LVAVTRQGQLLAYYRDKAQPTLLLYDLNARLVAQRHLSHRLMDLQVSSSGDLAVAGGFGDTAAVLSMHSLAVVGEVTPHAPECGSIRAVCISDVLGGAVLLGTASGHVEVHPIPVAVEAGKSANGSGSMQGAGSSNGNGSNSSTTSNREGSRSRMA